MPSRRSQCQAPTILLVAPARGLGRAMTEEFFVLLNKRGKPSLECLAYLWSTVPWEALAPFGFGKNPASGNERNFIAPQAFARAQLAAIPV